MAIMNLFLKILPVHLLLVALPLSSPQTQINNEHNKTVQPNSPNNAPFVFLTLPGVDNFAVMSHSRPEAALKKLRSHVRKQKQDERREEEEEREEEDEERRRAFDERRARMEERRERRLLRHQQRLLRNHQEHQQRLLDRNAAVQQRIQARLLNNVNRQRTTLGLEGQNTDDGAVVNNPNNENSNTNYQYDPKPRDAGFHVYKPPAKKKETYNYFPPDQKDHFSPPQKKPYDDGKKDPNYYNQQSHKYPYSHDNGETSGRYARDKKSKTFNPYLNEKKDEAPYKAPSKVEPTYQDDDDDDLDDVHSNYNIKGESSKRSYQRYKPSLERIHQDHMLVGMPSNTVPRYAFAYGVNDPETGDVKGQIETRVGDIVRGQYSLRDNDGAVRTVTYVADAKSGFNAVVQRTNGVSGPVMTSTSHVAPLPKILPKPQEHPYHQRRGERGMLSSGSHPRPSAFMRVDREFVNNAPFRRHVHPGHFPFKK